MAHFYLSPGLADATIGDTVRVTDAEARHAVTVGRLRVGEAVRVGNGAGLVVFGVVRTVDSALFTLEVSSIEYDRAPSPAIWLAQALAKGGRDELAIQAATELGVDGIIPWAAGRSIVRWDGQKVRKHEARWESILREASKQSLRSRIPDLLPLASTATLVTLAREFRVIVLEPSAETQLSAFTPDGRDLLVIVGPEGGIAPAELAKLEAGESRSFSLGRTVLRTSTAGPAAIAALNVLLGRW